jgi:hypothetical protein
VPVGCEFEDVGGEAAASAVGSFRLATIAVLLAFFWRTKEDEEGARKIFAWLLNV